MTRKIRIGIVGLQPGVSWAARAHLPALASLADRFEIAGVANTSRESAEAAANACGIPRAFDDVADMAASPEIDLISVTVRVPHHLALVRAAVTGGKSVYCEWPLGNGLAEAEEMVALVQGVGVRGFAGTQARVAPAVQYLGLLLREGYVGRVLSVTVTAFGRSWGPTHADARNRGYLLDKANGATMLTIPLGHTLAGITQALGPFTEVSSQVINRRGSILLPETGETVPFDAPDQVLIAGLLGGEIAEGAPISIHYRGGMPRDRDGFVMEINGTEGDLRLLGRHGGVQQIPLRIEGGRGEDCGFAALPVPESLTGQGWPEDVNPGNVARMYARVAEDLATGSTLAPSFEDALQLHRLIDTIERASRSGQRLPVPEGPAAAP
ncbi:Gfo/Idh/MocA family protein [Alterinioella nitratireducens]|uniref:Gfo/Idh/MocA family protein n=1 Tax=Alterinioella nitratireducens TaxID=2735915 RepID=UPI0015553916|nr:Gfo/Idh/MocA family oxidoreductase [Alterinioella nitratireducens]NPD21484.1 Gfo/Idh/MocA family oxidoreductase [Alterinioella nitratireducens]